MKNTNHKTVSMINRLIETCRDGENGYRAAAKGVQDFELKMLFQNYEQQRIQFGSELQAEVLALGGDPQNDGSLSGKVHRGWMSLKSAMTGSDEDAIIAQCEQGEDAAVRSYKEALQSDLPASARMVAERQFTQIQQAHDTIRALEKTGMRN